MVSCIEQHEIILKNVPKISSFPLKSNLGDLFDTVNVMGL